MRATYYYRSLHDLELGVNFDYIADNLSPRTPTAQLACETVRLCSNLTKIAEIKTHLDNYRVELKALNRKPLKSDFVVDAEWYVT